jgi:hypothetical protein
MKRQPLLTAIVLGLISLTAFTLPSWSQSDERGESSINTAQPTGITPDEIIRRFAAKEAEFKQARDQYTYTQDIRVQASDGRGNGEFRQVEDVIFDDKGRRTEHVTFAPMSTLDNGGVSMSREDMDDIRHRLPFVLTTEEIPQYSILYAGQQREDELHTYVFDIAPKTIEKGKRYFQGRIWVDNQDFQIVKTEGKTVPDIRGGKHGENENLFPKFTTWREQIDGRYWFPTYTKANDTLHFKLNDVHIVEIVKYTNYKRFGSNVRITYEGQEVEKAPEGQQQPQSPQQPQSQQQPRR